MSANLIIETEFFRRKLLRIGNNSSEGDLQIWDMGDTDYKGISYILQAFFGRPILSRPSIIAEIRAQYINKYDFELAEQEEEPAVPSNAAGGASASGGAYFKDLQAAIEREFKRQQVSLLREISANFQKDLEPVVEIVSKLGYKQNESNEYLSSKVEEIVKSLGEDMKEFVPNEKQKEFEDKLDQFLRMEAAKKKVEAVDGDLNKLKNYVGEIDKRLTDYKDFFQGSSFANVVDIRTQLRKASGN